MGEFCALEKVIFHPFHVLLFVCFVRCERIGALKRPARPAQRLLDRLCNLLDRICNGNYIAFDPIEVGSELRSSLQLMENGLGSRLLACIRWGAA